MWTPQVGPQADAISATWCPELLFGGAKYGGKSDFLLGDFLQDVPRYQQNWHGILFRQEGPQLDELIRRSHEFYPSAGGEWGEQKKTWAFPRHGSTLKMRQIEKKADIGKFQGHSYTWIGFDELGNWENDEVYRLCGLGNLRWGGASVPTKRIRCSANPGGSGHHWVSDYFINRAPLGYEPHYDSETQQHRLFIPSKITDNKIGTALDPGYIHRLRGLGSPEMVRAWLEGDWSVVTGAYFPEFSMSRHVVYPHEIPSHWTRIRGFDWGSSRPFSVGWFAVSDGSDPRYPTNCLIQYREWYGCSGPNKGLKMGVEDIADGILEREGKNEDITFSVADPAIFKEEGGPSFAERMRKRGVSFRRADNARITGWGALRTRLIGLDGSPMIYFFSTCPHGIRTLPALQHDSKVPEDVDSNGEDHAPDMTRYVAMSRPWFNEIIPDEPLRGHDEMSIDELWDKQKHYGNSKW